MIKVKRQSITPRTNQYEMRTPRIGQRELELSRQALKLLKNGAVNRRNGRIV